VRTGEVDGIVVSSLDRLARSLTVQEATLAKVWAHGGAVLTADAGEVPRDDPDDPMRAAVRQIVGVVAELDRKLVVKRLRQGRATKAASGGYAGGGQPLGLRAEGGTLLPADDEAETVELIVSRRAAGASYREVCRELAAAGLVPRKGGSWQAAVVRRVALRAGLA
jgi:DNA invertase Pin-like site-specific DNA recombinase